MWSQSWSSSLASCSLYRSWNKLDVAVLVSWTFFHIAFHFHDLKCVEYLNRSHRAYCLCYLTRLPFLPLICAASPCPNRKLGGLLYKTIETYCFLPSHSWYLRAPGSHSWSPFKARAFTCLSTMLSIAILGIIGVIACRVFRQHGQPLFFYYSVNRCPKVQWLLTFSACHFQPQGPQNVCPHGLPTCEATLNIFSIWLRGNRVQHTRCHNICNSIVIEWNGTYRGIYVHGARKLILISRKDSFEIVVSPHFPFSHWRQVLYRVICVRSLARHSRSGSVSLLTARRFKSLNRRGGWLSN